jgi:predicted RNase H-like HicB family nuclease
MTPPASPSRFRIAIHRWHGRYLARAIDLPGCVSCGDSEVEAVENARVAIRAYVRIARMLAAERAMVEVEISA